MNKKVLAGLIFALCGLAPLIAKSTEVSVLSENALQKLKDVGLTIEHTEPSPVSGIFTVVSQQGVSYVDKEGDYIFTGSLFKVNGKDVENTTEQAVLKGVRSFVDRTKVIEYKSPQEKYSLAIFTDITCGFCQKLHHDIDSYLKAGITIKFLAFPRAGLNSVVANNMAKIWCAADPAKALTDAMNSSNLPEGRPDDKCSDIIKSHYQIASTIPLQGTPTMVTLSGKPQVFTGWLSPDSIVKQMDASAK